MSWIGRKIYEYLKECEDFKKEMNAGYQPNDRLDTSNPPISDAFVKRKSSTDIVEEYLTGTSRDKVLEDWDANRLHNFFSGKSFAGLDKRKVGKEMSNAKGCIPRTECLQPAPEQKLKPFGICTETGMLVFCNDAKDNLTYKEKQPERVPFENFKNNRKKMKKEVRHRERYIITSVKEDGKVSITIEPKKGYDVCNVSLNVVTGELPKEPVLPKELLCPKPKLQSECDTLAKLIATRDYYNGGVKMHKTNCVYAVVICSDLSLQMILSHEAENFALNFKNEETANKFLENFRTEIESVSHLI